MNYTELIEHLRTWKNQPNAPTEKQMRYWLVSVGVDAETRDQLMAELLRSVYSDPLGQ